MVPQVVLETTSSGFTDRPLTLSLWQKYLEPTRGFEPLMRFPVLITLPL